MTARELGDTLDATKLKRNLIGLHRLHEGITNARWLLIPRQCKQGQDESYGSIKDCFIRLTP